MQELPETVNHVPRPRCRRVPADTESDDGESSPSSVGAGQNSNTTVAGGGAVVMMGRRNRDEEQASAASLRDTRRQRHK